MKLKVVNLNINTGHGPVGNFRQKIPLNELIRNLDSIATAFDKIQPDVVCLQEVDINWAGTHGINQAEYLAKRINFPYLHYRAHHKSPFSGKIKELFSSNVVFARDCGTAILSKHPITFRESWDFGEDISDNKTLVYWAKLLNESKGFTYCELDFEGKKIGVISVHLLNDIVYQIFNKLGRNIRGETFARIWQLECLLEKIEQKRKQTNIPIVVAGDFNSIPRESASLHYIHSKNGDPDDYRRDVTMQRLRETKIIRTISKLFGSGNAESILPYHTYPSINPDRTIDYIFITEELKFATYEIIQQPLSDHLAVIAEIKIKKTKSKK